MSTIDVLNKIYSKVNQDVIGSFLLRRIRQTLIMNEVCPFVTGDFLEIGCYRGETSVRLLELGMIFNRHLHCIDPWCGEQDGSQAEFEEFAFNTSGFPNLTILRESSFEELGKQYIQRLDLSFAFLDGLHTAEALSKDLYNVAPRITSKGIICVDDFHNGFHSTLKEPVETFLHYNKDWVHIESPSNCQETYLVKL